MERPVATHGKALRIGIVSDTHGLLRPQAAAFLHGCDHIVHAGDICDAATLAAIAAIAPVTAVRGNNDRGGWAAGLPETTQVELGGVAILVVHDLATLAPGAVPAGVQFIVCGHSHRPRIERRDGLVVMNPGSAGRRRFRLPVSIGEIVIAGGVATPRLVELAVA